MEEHNSYSHVAGPSVNPSQEHEQIVLLLVGLVGAGKSTFAQALEAYFPQFIRCNQDELGDRRTVEMVARQRLQEGRSVCIDRTNFDASQRATWITLARQFPKTKVWVLVFDTSYDVCAARLQTRTGHPTLTSAPQALSILSRFSSLLRLPQPREGYDSLEFIRPGDEIGAERESTHEERKEEACIWREDAIRRVVTLLKQGEGRTGMQAGVGWTASRGGRSGGDWRANGGRRGDWRFNVTRDGGHRLDSGRGSGHRYDSGSGYRNDGGGGGGDYRHDGGRGGWRSDVGRDGGYRHDSGRGGGYSYRYNTERADGGRADGWRGSGRENPTTTQWDKTLDAGTGHPLNGSSSHRT